jgi:hypothetical protein
VAILVNALKDYLPSDIIGSAWDAITNYNEFGIPIPVKVERKFDDLYYDFIDLEELHLVDD